MIQKRQHHIILFLSFLLPLFCRAQDQRVLSLPRLEQLPSSHVTQVIQDAEGFLWYATEGGGVCRDDGRQMMVFRSDAEHPDLLGSNDVASIANAGRYIIIGTYHGACLLDKQDYSIRRLSRAAELLREGRLNITEVSYATGFSSVSYFSRCFRTMHGVSPTQFIEESKMQDGGAIGDRTEPLQAES